MTLNLPLDFERLPEFWQLKETLRTAWMERMATAGLPPSQSIALGEGAQGASGGAPAAAREARALPELEGEIDDVAAVLWIRLWVVLGYLARATNRPGWLNASGERQLNYACGRKFGEDCPPVSILTAATVLRKAEPRLGIEDGYMCDLFAMVNPQLAGNFLTKEERGNRRSLVGRSKNVIAHDAVAQAQLLPRDFFRKRDGMLMQQPEVDRSMIIIISLDRALKLRARLQSTYTQGLWGMRATPAARPTVRRRGAG
jgi:hypothetical protein